MHFILSERNFCSLSKLFETLVVPVAMAIAFQKSVDLKTTNKCENFLCYFSKTITWKWREDLGNAIINQVH